MTFINSFFLFALGAAALPLLIHLVRRMKAKKVVFSSLRFLKATPKEVVRRRRLKDILLMALRMAVLALVALAFARPFIPKEQIPFLDPRDDVSTVYLLDTSYSMQRGDTFAEARQAIAERLQAMAGDDEAALLTFSDEVVQQTALSIQVDLHTRVVESALEPSFRGTDVHKALQRAVEVLGGARHGARAIVLVSDFQQAGWTGALDNWKLPSGITFVPVPVGEGAAADNNAYFSAFNLGMKRFGAGVAVRYDARVEANGPLAQQPKAVALQYDATERLRSQTAPLARSTVTFQHQAPREGVFQGSLQLGADVFELDNHWYFTYVVEDRPSILVIDDAPRGVSQDAFFLEKAFDVGERALYQFNSGTRARLTAGELRRHEVVFLTNLPALSAAQTGVVRQYVEAGGSLVVSPGPQVTAAGLTRTLAALGVGRVSAIVNARSLQAQEAIIGDVDLKHPVFSLFGEVGRGTILRPKIRRYVQVRPDSGATVVAAYDAGDPMLLEAKQGRGRVLVYTSTFSTNWTDFPLNEMYVPFLYQLVRYALDVDAQPLQYQVGDVVALRGRPGEEWDVRTPADEQYKVSMDETGVGYFRETHRPGHYVAAGAGAPLYFSVNLDTRESDFTARDVEEAYAAVVPPPEHLALTPEQATLTLVEEEERTQKMWRYLLLLALGLFVVETVLAHRNPRERVTARSPNQTQ